MTTRAPLIDALLSAAAYLDRRGVKVDLSGLKKRRKPQDPLTNRAEFERKLERKLTTVLGSQYTRLLTYLGDPPDAANVPASFWQEVGKEAADEIRPAITEVYLEMARETLRELPVGVNWELVNEAAADWAGRYAGELVRGIDQTSQERIQDAIARFYRDGLTREELEASLRGAFGPDRASMIAVTEVTRAASEGENETRMELAEQGIEMVAIWQTNADDLVCPVCGPLDGTQADGYEGDEPYWEQDGERIEKPPAHVNCRCWTTLEFA